MSTYRIFETNQFSSDLNDVRKDLKDKIRKKFLSTVYLQLCENPHYGLNIRKLKAYKPETWRYRIGDYRLFFEIDEKEKIVFIISMDIRKDAYK